MFDTSYDTLYFNNGVAFVAGIYLFFPELQNMIMDTEDLVLWKTEEFLYIQVTAALLLK